MDKKVFLVFILFFSLDSAFGQINSIDSFDSVTSKIDHRVKNWKGIDSLKYDLEDKLDTVVLSVIKDYLNYTDLIFQANNASKNGLKQDLNKKVLYNKLSSIYNEIEIGSNGLNKKNNFYISSTLRVYPVNDTNNTRTHLLLKNNTFYFSESYLSFETEKGRIANVYSYESKPFSQRTIDFELDSTIQVSRIRIFNIYYSTTGKKMVEMKSFSVNLNGGNFKNEIRIENEQSSEKGFNRIYSKDHKKVILMINELKMKRPNKL